MQSDENIRCLRERKHQYGHFYLNDKAEYDLSEKEVDYLSKLLISYPID
jgi:hypothetical protein